MKIHLRSCANEAFINQKYTNVLSEQRGPSTVCSNLHDRKRFRLSRDQVAFNIIDNETDETSSMKEQDKLHEALLLHGLESDLVASSYTSTSDQVTNLIKANLGRLGRMTSFKEIDKIIKLLAHPSFELKPFLSSCSSYRECMVAEETELNNSLHTIGFKKQTVTDPATSISCELYLRSAVEVLARQISDVSNKSCFFHPPSEKEKNCHPMMAELGKHGISAISNSIKGSTESDVLWYDCVSAIESSFVGLVQIYSDKSKTSLKESAFLFYPLHITLLNFSEEHRRKCIVNGSTFLAFLPVSFYKVREGVKYPAKIDRPQKLRLLHMAVDVVLQDLRKYGFTGFTCTDTEGVKRRCHPCLVSYCSDLPEAKDMTSIRNGNSSERNCHRCLAVTKDFNGYTNSTLRHGDHTVKMITDARKLRDQGKRDESEQLMNKYSLADQIPSLHSLPFMGLHPTLDMHALYAVEPLHVFHLGISKELKKCLSERLRIDSKVTESIPTKGGIYRLRTFKSVRMLILNGVNRMMSHIQSASPAKGLRIDFSTTGKGESGNGLYADDGKLIGMLEAKDYRSVDMVFPFVGMLVDRCCGEEATAVCTKLFVLYVEIMLTTMSYIGTYEWSEQKIQNLEVMIKTFKSNATELFASHQPSQLRTEKFHMLDHIVQDIRRMGGIVFADAGLYEYTHTLVKQAYRTGSRRRQTAMDETVNSFLKEMNHSSLYELFNLNQRSEESSKGNDTVVNSCPASEEAMLTDCPVLVKKGKAFSLSELRVCRANIRKLRKAKEMGNEQDKEKIDVMMRSVNQTVSDILRDVTEDGSRILINQLHEIMNPKGSEGTRERFTVSRVTSGYVGGIETPTGKDVRQRGGKLIIKRSPVRCLQRIVSERGFYGSTTLRQDCVLLQANESSADKMDIWVGKVLLMLRLRRSEVSKGGDESFQDQIEEEYIFVQYFDIQRSQDEIDHALGCVRLRWARDDENDNLTSARKWFDLLPASSIRGVVHVVRGDYGKNGNCITKDMDDVPWFDQSFYINRFYFNSDNKRYSYQSDS